MFKTEMERLCKFVDTHGFWFASCPEYKKMAEELCVTGKLRCVREIVDRSGSNDFYVPAAIKSQDALPHGLYRHLVLWVPCQGGRV